MSQNTISTNKRLSMIGSMFLHSPLPPYIESKERENFKLCRVNSYGTYLPPSPSEIHRYENWHDNNNEAEDYFSFPANYLATSNETRSKHSTQAFARLETAKENNNNNRTFTKMPQKAIVESPKTTVDDENLVLQLEDTTIPPMSPSSSTSTFEESDIDDINQEDSTVIYKHSMLQKRSTKDFDSYVSEFIRYNESSMKNAKKQETPTIFKKFF